MLDKLVASEKQTQKRLASIEKSLNMLLTVNTKEAKREATAERRRQAVARREKSDRRGTWAQNRKKEAEEAKSKKKGGIFDTLKNMLMGVLAAPLLIKAVGAALIGGAALLLSNKEIRDKLFDLMGKAAKKMGSILVDMLGKAFEGLKKFAKDTYESFSSKGYGKRESIAEAKKGATEKEVKELEKLDKAFAEKLYRERQYYKWKDTARKMEEEGSKKDAKRAEEEAKKEKEKADAQLAEIKRIRELNIAKNIGEEQDLRFRSAAEAAKGMNALESNLPYGAGKFNPDGLQRGGPVKVPGSGSGDKMFTVVQPGSFVMNRNAVGGYQTGGVPVMLEPGEEVYAPGTWGPVEQMMNSLIPRFQQGGAVGDAKNPSSAESKGTNQKGGTGKGSDPSKVTPGGKAEFIGTGDGITGEFSLIDGDGKKVGSWQATSGTFATAKTTQEQRMQVSGRNYPLPDGSYPLLPMTYHPGQLVGDWSSYINNGTGSIGARSQLLVHNDITDNGTAGCIGINNLGGRGSKKSMAFAKLFERVAPTGVRVALTESGGKPGTGVTEGGGKGGGLFGGGGGSNGGGGSGFLQGASDAVGGFLGNIGSGFHEGLSQAGLPGLADLMQIMGEEATRALGPMANMIFGGIGNFFSGFGAGFSGKAQARTPQSGTFGQTPGALDQVIPGPGISPKNETGGGGSAGGMADGAKPGAMGVVGGMGFNQAQWDIYRNTLAKIESGGVYDIAGGSGGHYDGRYQLGAAAKTDAARILGVQDPGHGPGARDAYRKNPKMQEEFFAAFTKANYNYLMRNPKFAEAKPGRKLEILGYAHNQGMGGAENWLNTGRVGADGFGTKGTAYSEALKTNLKAAGYQQGGIVDMRGRAGNHMTRFNQAQQMFEKAAAASAPIIINNMGGGGAGVGAGMQGEMRPQGTPGPPTLPDGPSVVALMDLTNRVALGAMI